MALLKYSLGLAILVLTVEAVGQEPVLTGPPLPPEPAVESLTQDWIGENCYLNSYPMYRCEDGHCCNQWWCESWYGRIELLTLARNYTSETRTIISGLGAPAFTTDDIGFKLAPGLSTLLGHRIDGDSAMEAVYFGANQWNLDRASTGTSIVDFTLRSQLHNAEINYLQDLPNISLLAGFRYLYLGEQLALSNNTVGDIGTRLSNNFTGGQLGFRSASYWRGLDLEMTGKAGLYGNQASAAQGFRNLTRTIDTSVGVTNATLSFIGDINFSATCPITRNCRLRAGYNLLYLSGVALAANQPNFFALGARHVRQDGDVFLHGFNVGLESTW